MNNRIYVAIDVETTGLQSGLDEIIEVAAVTFRGREILDRFSQLVRPRQSVPLKITRLTGIDPKALAQAPRFNEIGAELARFIGNRPIVGHSIGFDLTMLRAQGMHFNQPVYDTFELATLLLPQVTGYKLDAGSPSRHSPPRCPSCAQRCRGNGSAFRCTLRADVTP